eukprot:TRINITY_DN10227_c0_g1_i1.p3 TRINITY_DN10227_c0_g1~~TRINITY_DN10227_c0_g1_i1.p3  ORF type:complete len:230 (+),score=19.16 TRINITY_DN10227_c0_g1_i1:2549-3238(+)
MDANLDFMRREHAKTLSALHEEVARLKETNKELLFKLNIGKDVTEWDHEDCIPDESKASSTKCSIRHDSCNLPQEEVESAAYWKARYQELNTQLSASQQRVVILEQQLLESDNNRATARAPELSAVDADEAISDSGAVNRGHDQLPRPPSAPRLPHPPKASTSGKLRSSKRSLVRRSLPTHITAEDGMQQLERVLSQSLESSSERASAQRPGSSRHPIVPPIHPSDSRK